MRSKQFGALHMVILAALLASSIVIGLVVLIFLDRAMLARTAARGELSAGNYTTLNRDKATRDTMIFELTQPTVDQNARDDNRLKASDIDPATAREALRTAPAEAIQHAVKAKTGKTVSVDKIEAARQKALSPDGQRKINDALQRRDEVDLSKIREKLKQ